MNGLQGSARAFCCFRVNWPFIMKFDGKMMSQMELWAESENHHVRRLACEGCRPRLPWAMALTEFIRDPAPVMPILEKLKNDESEYVRGSVANNLNDISKDNLLLVVEIARNWLGGTPQTDWVIKHACRTLLKQGHSEIMELKVQQAVDIGERMEFSFIIARQA